MDIKFSDKYEPLFKLLNAWDVVNDPSFKDIHSKEQQKEWLDLKGVDTIVISGGRDSGKTFGVSTFIPIAVKDFNHRVLYTRYTMKSTDQSINKALNSRMELLGIDGNFEYANNVYTCPDNDGQIFITGQKTSAGNETAKLKSLEDFSIFITDEADEQKTFEEWDKIRKSIRAKDVQCFNMIVFNPTTRDHWIYTDLFEDMEVEEGFNGIKDNILYIHTSYLDMEEENIAEHNLREYKKLRVSYDLYEGLSNIEREDVDYKIRKEWKKYKNIVLGGFLDTADGVIYEDWKEGEFREDLPSCFGLDFGFNDPDALTKVSVDRNEMKIYLKQLYFKNNTGTKDLIKIIKDITGGSNMIIADAAQKRLINDMYHEGLNIRRCKKGGGSVERGIKTIQGYTLIVDPESKDIKKALNNYVWHDKRAGVPKHDWSDLCDSFRYAAIELILY